MRRPLLALVIAAPLALTTSAHASDSGGAAVPKTSRQVVHGGGAAYAPARPRRRAAKRPPARRPARTRHHFPVAGAYGFGESGSRFGAPRKGHTHQGQDMAAAEGTPVVAPTAGVVHTVGYQAAGAGNYVVLEGEGKDRTYVFMHLRSGSITVREGQRVRGGGRLGDVGNTGRSFGAHLHFEIWVGGGWYRGGRPIDPLPLLRSWVVR